MSDTPGTHGSVGRREGAFVRLFDRRLVDFDAAALRTLATQMIGNAGDKASNSPMVKKTLPSQLDIPISVNSSTMT